MDPDTLVADLYALRPNSAEYKEGMQNLREWVAKGGFKPSVTRVVPILYTRDVGAHIDEFYSLFNEPLVQRLMERFGCTRD